MMKSDAAKEARVAKNERPFRLMQNQMVVFLRTKATSFDAQLAGHSEVNTEPALVREREEHLFSPGLRAEKAGACQLADKSARVRPAKDPLQCVKLHPHDLLTQSGIPLPAKIFHFGEFRHGGLTLWPRLRPVPGCCDG